MSQNTHHSAKQLFLQHKNAAWLFMPIILSNLKKTVFINSVFTKLTWRNFFWILLIIGVPLSCKCLSAMRVWVKGYSVEKNSKYHRAWVLFIWSWKSRKWWLGLPRYYSDRHIHLMDIKITRSNVREMRKYPLLLTGMEGRYYSPKDH